MIFPLKKLIKFRPQEQLVGKLIEAPEKGTDMESRVLAAYISQCTAEAQESMVASLIVSKY